MWTAYFQADGELRHTIAVAKFSWTAEQKAKEFQDRMTHPEVGLWWIWVEGDDETNGEENNEAKALTSDSEVDAVVPSRNFDAFDFGPIGPFRGFAGDPF
jgi:hypothetical protein